MLQTRPLRAQAEGLALMREIHRSTVIPQRHERLHRILTLLADLFEAREVALFAAVAPGSVQPAACLRITNKEEIFVTFDTEELVRTLAVEENSPAAPHANLTPHPPSLRGKGETGKLRRSTRLLTSAASRMSVA